MQETEPRIGLDDAGSGHRTIEVHGWIVRGGPDLRAHAYPGGPTIVRDAHAIAAPDGSFVPVDRPTIAICRCGKSRLAPACDGTHRAVRDLADIGPVPSPQGTVRA